MSAVVFIILQRQQELVDRFRSLEARSADRAVSLEKLAVPRTHVFDRLTKAGVLASTDDGRWFMREEAWSAFRSRQQSRLLWLAAIIIVLGAAVVGLLMLR